MKNYIKFISRPNFNLILSTKKIGIIINSNLNDNATNTFISHLIQFLNPNKINFRIYIIDSNNFSIGQLYNIGYKIAKEDKCEYMIFHNNNLLPNNDCIGYYTTYPIDPINISYLFSKNKMDVLSINKDDFEKCGGFNMNHNSNIIDNIYKSLKNLNISLQLPSSGTFTQIDSNNKSKLNKKLNKEINSNLINIKYIIQSKYNINQYTIYYKIK